MTPHYSPHHAPRRADGQRKAYTESANLPDTPPGILVVDDEPLVRNLLERALGREGFRVWTVSDGWQAQVRYECLRQEIAVVLLDVRMPGLDGPETLSALQRVNPEVCCCFMSGDTGPHATAELLERGAVLVFAKPFRLEEVTGALWSLVDHNGAGSRASFNGSPRSDFQAPLA